MSALALWLLTAAQAMPQVPEASLWNELDSEVAGQRVTDLVNQIAFSNSNEALIDEAWNERGAEIRSYGPLAVQTLSWHLESENPSLRRAAFLLLVRIGGNLAIKPLLGLARSESDPAIRLEALQRLVEDYEFVQVSRLVLRVSAQEDDSDVCRYARQVLNRLTSRPRLPEPLEEAHPSSSPARVPAETSEEDSTQARVRQIVADVTELGTLRSADGRVVAISRSYPEGIHRKEILAIGPAAIPALVEYGWSGSTFEWIIACGLLSALGGGEMVEPLSQIVLEKPFRRVRALSAMVEGTGFTAIAHLLEEISAEQTPSGEFARQILQTALPPASQ